MNDKEKQQLRVEMALLQFYNKRTEKNHTELRDALFEYQASFPEDEEQIKTYFKKYKDIKDMIIAKEKPTKSKMHWSIWIWLIGGAILIFIAGIALGYSLSQSNFINEVLFQATQQKVLSGFSNGEMIFKNLTEVCTK